MAPNLSGTEGNWCATTNQEYDAVNRGATTYTEQLQRGGMAIDWRQERVKKARLELGSGPGGVCKATPA